MNYLRDEILLGRYKVISLLGEGGMGSTYLVYDEVKKERLALKVLNLQDENSITAFKSEFESLSKFRHPNLVYVFEFGLIDDKIPFYTMEYVEGKNVKEYFSTISDFNAEVLYHITVQIFSSLDYIHNRKIIHGDIKPENIFVQQKSNERPVAKLLDFGLSQSIFSKQNDGLTGTLEYISPEKIKKENIDGRSDLYSFGIVLFEILAGEVPFNEKETLKIFRRHLFDEITSINSKLAVSDEFKKIVIRLLRKEPCDRYQTAFNAAKDTAALYGESLSDDDSVTKDFYFTSGPLTGRDKELEQFLELIQRDSSPKFAVLKGEAGTGKTRLLKELKIRSQLNGIYFIDIPVIEKSVKAFAPVFDIINEIKRLLPVEESDKFGKLLNVIKQDSENSDNKQTIYDETSFILEIIDFITAASKSEKIVVAFDDLQNADGGTLDFIEYFERNLNLNENKNISLIVSYQPEISAEADELIKEIEDNSKLLSINLEGIGKEKIGEYIRSVLGIELLPDKFIEKLADETSGNFLFIEELLKILLEEGFIYRKEGRFELKPDAEFPKLPASVLDAFKARFEKFSGDEKEFLYKVSVLSGNFDVELCKAVTGIEFVSLNNYLKKFLNEGLLISETSGYRFKSEKIKNLLYDEFGKEKRKTIHGLIADYYKAIQLDNKNLYSELLAFHLFSAERFGEAIPLLTKSGDKAKEIFANGEAEDFYKKAVLSMEKIGEKFSMGKYAVYSKLADVYDLSGKRDEQALILNNMLKIAEKFLDNHKIADVYILQSKLFYAIGEYEKAKNIGEKAVTLKERIDDLKGKADALVAVGSALFKMGEVQQFLKYYEEAIKIYEEENCDIEYGLALVDLGIAYWSNLDTPEKAIEYYDKALAIFEKADYPKGKLRAIGNTALAYYTLGKYEKSLEFHLKAKELCEKLGNSKGYSTSLANVGKTKLALFNFTDALLILEEGILFSQSIIDKFTEIYEHISIGMIYNMVGMSDFAIDHFLKGITISKKINDQSGENLCYINIAYALIKLNRISVAENYLQKAEELIDENSDMISRINVLIPKVSILIEGDGLQDVDIVTHLLNQVIELSIQSSDVDSEIYARSLHGYVYYKLNNLQKALEQSQVAIRKVKELNYIPTDYPEILWNHYLILKAKGEKNLSIETLKKAYNHIINISKNITDLSMRESYLEKAQPNSDIVKEYKNIIEGVSAEDSTAKIRLNNLETLYRITQKIISILDLDELLNAVMDLALETLKGERGMIFLMEDDELRLKAARNVERQSVKDASEISMSVLNDVALGGKPILTMDAAGDEKLMQRQSIMNFNIKSLVCVPIKLKDKILGTVYVDSTGSSESIVAFTSIDLEFLEAFAGIVAISIENARLLKDMKDENVYLRNEVEEKYRFENIIGNSESLTRVYKVMEGAIKSEGTVMIQGESGTGKELVAKAIHFNSARKKERFVAVDCAALHETLLDSELFGHKKGSFTGAIQDKKGLFEEADKGSIFLDEITNTSLSFQAKLLRVLQEGEIRRVGDTDSKFVDVRVIVAANRNIEEEVKAGRFREDLYYRLNVIPIFVPPLRERREDIPLLVDHFIKKYQVKTAKVIKSISQELVDRFTSYDWPGNIREMENIINRMIIFAEEEKLTLKDIPADFQKVFGKSDPVAEIFKNNDEISNIKELEKEHILRTLQKTGGNKSEAAKLLGLKRTTLIERMKKYGLMAK